MFTRSARRKPQNYHQKIKNISEETRRNCGCKANIIKSLLHSHLNKYNLTQVTIIWCYFSTSTTDSTWKDRAIVLHTT